MKKTILFFSAVVAVYCGFAAGTLRTAGSFLDGAWRDGSPYINPTYASISSSAVTFTANPDPGFGVAGWYYRTTLNVSGNQRISDWSELPDSGEKMSYAIPAESPFSTSSSPVNYLALNLRYVKFGLLFNYNGGSGAISSMTDLYITNSIALPMPNSRTGYAFGTWKCENGNTFQGGVVLGIDNVLNLGIGNADTNFTLTAQWTPNAYNVAFNANGGSGAMANLQMTYDVTTNLPHNAFTKVGYTFTGWATAPNGNVVYADGATVGNLASTQGATVTLYAKWTAKTSHVTFGKNGGSGGDSYVTATYGRPMPTPRTAPTKVGYAFDGYWNTLNNGKQYYDADMNSVRTWDKTDANATLWAKWIVNTYTIRFDANGASGTMQDMSMMYDVTTNLTLNAFTKVGYTFTGWATSQNGSVVYADGATVSNLVSVQGATVTLYAKWAAKTSKVTFGKNGGSGGDEYVTATYGQPMPSSSSVPTRTGYAFDGYWDSVTTGKQYYDARMRSVRSWDKTAANVKLWAKWIANTYTIRFDANGASGTMQDMLMSYGVTTNLTLNAFTKGGHTFTGWATSQNGNVVYADGAAVSNLSATQGATVTLYAKWTAKTSKVTFGKNGGSGGDEFVTATYGQPMPTPCTAPTKVGYTFDGYWNTLNNGKQYYDAGMNSVRNWDKTDANVKLWAKWTANTYAIRFNANGGSGAMSNISMRYDMATNLTLNAFAKVGYTFAGWATSPNDGVVYADGATVSNLAFAQGAIVDLYAKWAANTYTVKFSANGGSGSMPDMSVAYDVETNLIVNAFTKVGYTFLGWATSPDGAVAYENGADVGNLASEQGAEVTLYAKWAANTYYVRFDPNGGSGTMPVLTNRYDEATVFPGNAFTPQSDLWRFSCWSNTVDGTTAAPGSPLLNLTAEPDATVVVDAVWATTLSDLSLAMHCYNLDWNNHVGGIEAPIWIAEDGAGLGYNSSGSQVSQAYRSPHSLQSAVSTNGTMSFYCKTESGSAGAFRIWIAQNADDPFQGQNVHNLYTNEVQLAAGGAWTKIEFEVPQNAEVLYVNIANRTDGDKLCIDMMTWNPAGSHVEPTEEDARNFTEMSIDDGRLSLAFTPDSRFAYSLHGTNDLSVARALWPVILTTNGTDVITIELPVESSKPCMFYYLETISK